MDRFWDQKLLAIFEMPKEKAKLAMKVLQTLSVAAGPLNFEAVCESLAVDPGAEPQVDRGRFFWDPNEFLDLCPGLVGWSTVHTDGPLPEKWPNLVHPSIREYLFSKRIGATTSLVREFSMNEDKANSDMAQTCLTYLVQFKGLLSGNQVFVAQYKFLQYAATFWNLHVKKINSPLSSSLKRRIIELFTSGQTCFQTWLQVYDPDVKKDHPVEATPFPSPLYYASLLDYPAAVRELLDRGAKVDEAKGKQRYPLLAAVENGHEAVARLLIEHGADVEARFKNKDPALVRAVQKGHVEIVALLIRKGVNVDSHDKRGQAALHCAVTYCWEKCESQIEIVRLLLNAGANIESKNQYGRTPLLQAVNHDEEQMVQLLLEAGADIEARDKDAMTPLHHAACCVETVMQCLLTKGAAIEAKDHRGFTPLLEAVARGREPGAKFLLQHGADVHAHDQNGWTALHFASTNGSEPLVRLLLEYGSNIRIRANKEETVLHPTVGRCHEPVVRLLLEHGVEINAKDTEGRTALHVVVEAGEYGESFDEEERTAAEQLADTLKIARALLENGADTALQDAEGKTALEIAQAKNYEAMAQILTENMTNRLKRRNHT